MQEFDTLSISLPASSIRKQRQSIWIETTKLDHATGLLSKSLQMPSQSLPIGVSRLATAKGGKDFELTFSAKVLGPDYLQGLTLNNWERVIDSLTPIIEIDKYQVFEQSKVFRCDTTNNIMLDDIGCDHSQVYLALLAAKANMNFLPIFWKSKKKLGIEFRGVQQEKNRLIAYCKHLDLEKTDNRKFRESLGTYHVGKLLEQSKGQVRFEVNHTTFRSMKDRLKIKDTYLQSVLNSKQPVNCNFLKKVMNVSDVRQTDIFGEWETFKQRGNEPLDFIYYKGIQAILREVDYSERLAKDIFKSMFEKKTNFDYHWHNKENSIKKILQVERAKQLGFEAKPLDNTINIILACLQKAVA